LTNLHIEEEDEAKEKELQERIEIPLENKLEVIVAKVERVTNEPKEAVTKPGMLVSSLLIP
jgi:hypothetical protein